MTTLNQIIKLFQDIATNHNQIQSFGFGDLWEYSANNDGLTKNKKTPTFWAVLEDSSLNDNELTLNFSLLFFDLVKKDEFNETEVLSDTLRIATDVWSILDDDNFYDNFTLTKTASLQDFTERFDDEVAGWKMAVSVRIQGAMDSCSIPGTIPTMANAGNNINQYVSIVDANGTELTQLIYGQTYTVTQLTTLLQTLSTPTTTIIQDIQ